MQKILLSFYFVLFVINLIKSQSIDLLNVNVQFTRTISSNSDSTLFRLSGPLANGVDINDAWLAIGLNDRSQMGGAHVFICRNSANTKWVRHYFTLYYILTLRDQSNPSLGLTGTQINTVSSNLTCEFTIDNSVLTQVNYAESFFMLAYGRGKFKSFLNN